MYHPPLQSLYQSHIFTISPLYLLYLLRQSITAITRVQRNQVTASTPASSARKSSPVHVHASSPSDAFDGGTDDNNDDLMDAVAIEEQLRKQREEQQSTSRGAGAILFSSLVYQGWRFPSFVLVDTDERYLFELEVKVKLSHVNCGTALMDCLVEYPPHALLSRAGLLQAMLDVLGSSEGTKEDFGRLPLFFSP